MTWLGNRSHANDINIFKTVPRNESIFARTDELESLRHVSIREFEDDSVVLTTELAQRVSGNKAVIKSIYPGTIFVGKTV